MIISSLTFFITFYLIFENRANSHSISHFFLFQRPNVEISTFLFLLIFFSFCFLRKFFRLNVLFLCVVAFSMPVCIASSSGFSTCIQSCIVSALLSSSESSLSLQTRKVRITKKELQVSKLFHRYYYYYSRRVSLQNRNFIYSLYCYNVTPSFRQPIM